MEWKRGPTIGAGSTAVVSLATTTTGDLFAVKSTDLSSSTPLQKEQTIISQLCSPYVLKCFGSEITYDRNKPEFNLFLEYVPNGTLSDLIKNQGGSLKENEIQFHVHEVLQGLNYLHGNGLVHCDIKGQNILIGKNGLKIADFGCAKWVVSDTSVFAGTPAYMAPEVARAEQQSFPADIWAVGCTIIEMATGTNPWPEMKSPASALYRIAYSGDVPEYPSWFSDTATDFLGKCLMRDSEERWTAAELLEHPFLNPVKEEIGELTKKSPTSVMDQGFWDDVLVTDSFERTTEMGLSSDSPAGRVRGLIGECFGSDLMFADWTEEDDWVTVRGNEIEECSNFDLSEEFEDLIDEEEIQTLTIGVEDSLLDCYIDERRSSLFCENVTDVPVLKFMKLKDNGIISSFRSTFSFHILLFYLDVIFHRYSLMCTLIKIGTTFTPFLKEVTSLYSRF
ncbi:hypothetical protein ACJIZ3_013075 [Penstemon smallii]|uniref:Protein kinase domain-containing protein n=1 Tax=Penstemon smallii TaxID=265156 RepID=A0ABD3USX3_9LAMI